MSETSNMTPFEQLQAIMRKSYNPEDYEQCTVPGHFKKGELYTLHGLSKNKQMDCMIEFEGVLYLTEGESRWSGYSNCPRHRDGDVFVCLTDAPEMDLKALAKAMRVDGEDLESASLRRRAKDMKLRYERRTYVQFLAPTGNVVRMTLRGNKGKFKRVKSRRRGKK